MQKISKLIAAACILGITCSLATGAGVLDRIPAGTMGYIATNNVNSTCNRMESFLDKIGVGQFLKMQTGETQPAHYLSPLLIQGAGLGDGFNIEGGFAVIMLDPAELGIDIAAELDKPSPDLANLPFAIYLPAKDLETVFIDREITDDESGFKKLSKNGDSILAMHSEDYAILSSNPKVLKTIKAASAQSAMQELTGEEKVLVNRGGIIIHMNIEKARPVFIALMKKAQQDMPKGDKMAPFMNMYVSIYEKMFEQFTSVTETITLAPEGLVFEEITTAAPGSAMGKILAAQSKTTIDPTTLLNAVPSTPYAVAIGSAGMSNDPVVVENSIAFIQDILADAPIESSTKEQIIAMSKDFYSQVTSCQMVIGGPVEDKGVFGAAIVLKCNDSAKLRQMVADKADLINNLMAEGKEETPKVKCVYTKAAEKVGTTEVDAFEIQCSELCDDVEKMKKVTAALGEDKIRFLIATPDSNTMVMTIGGSTAYMNTALGAAKGSNALDADLKGALALEFMPKNPDMVGLINVNNTIDLIFKGMEKVQPGSTEAFPAITISCKKPISFASENKAQSVHATAFVPVELFQDIVQMGMMMMMQNGGMGGGGF